ncbi:MAG: FKBP-type peptidyl-prolyl cis-trans isomerase [Deltaproteobacteria bacterium]
MMKKIVFILAIGALIASCKKEGEKIIKLPLSKSEYTLLKSGNGPKSKIGDYIYFSLLVKGNDGTILADKRDSATWAMDKVMQLDSSTIPLVEMLYSMKLGDSSLFKMPLTPEQKAPGMENIDTVFYYLKLEKITDEATLKKEQEAEEAKKMKKMEAAKPKTAEIEKLVSSLLTDFKSGKLKSKLQLSPAGVKYYIVEKGTGVKIMKNDLVSVAYHGVTEKDGNKFDSSVERGDFLQFNVGQNQMIPGFDEVVSLLNIGDKAVLFIPYNLAYGEAGRPPVIPEKANLVFYIEILSVSPKK